MYDRLAFLYDPIYHSFKDYAAEAAQVRGMVRDRTPGAQTLLDVACGTGSHLVHLARDFEVEGLDASPQMLAIAREKNPGVAFHEADMVRFDLGKRYDAVTCLFSSVGHLPSTQELESAVSHMARHLRPHGVLLLEPWITPAEFEPGHLGAQFVDEPELKIARIAMSEVDGKTSRLRFDYLVGTPNGISHHTEVEELTLFERDEYLMALEHAELDAEFDPEGFMGRGLYIARKPRDVAGERGLPPERGETYGWTRDEKPPFGGGHRVRDARRGDRID